LSSVARSCGLDWRIVGHDSRVSEAAEFFLINGKLIRCRSVFDVLVVILRNLITKTKSMKMFMTSLPKMRRTSMMKTMLKLKMKLSILMRLISSSTTVLLPLKPSTLSGRSVEKSMKMIPFHSSLKLICHVIISLT
jgi:hypothetical protein